MSEVVALVCIVALVWWADERDRTRREREHVLSQIEEDSCDAHATFGCPICFDMSTEDED